LLSSQPLLLLLAQPGCATCCLEPNCLVTTQMLLLMLGVLLL
jgi:hypothetical protein